MVFFWNDAVITIRHGLEIRGQENPAVRDVRRAAYYLLLDRVGQWELYSPALECGIAGIVMHLTDGQVLGR